MKLFPLAACFVVRSELDKETLADIRLALSQGQGRFDDQIFTALGIKRTQKRPGRPAGETDQLANMALQTGFGF